MFGRLAIAAIGVFAILLARWPERPEPGNYAPYYTLLAACLLNLVYLILARTGVGLRGLATVQLSLDILIVGNTWYASSGIVGVRSFCTGTWGPILVRSNNFIGQTTIGTHASGSPTSESWSDNTPSTRDNRHYGSAAVATGGTIAHTLRATPTSWGVQPITGTATGIFVTADATNLTVTFGGGGTQTFKWWAEI